MKGNSYLFNNNFLVIYLNNKAKLYTPQQIKEKVCGLDLQYNRSAFLCARILFTEKVSIIPIVLIKQILKK